MHILFFFSYWTDRCHLCTIMAEETLEHLRQAWGCLQFTRAFTIHVAATCFQQHSWKQRCSSRGTSRHDTFRETHHWESIVENCLFFFFFFTALSRCFLPVLWVEDLTCRLKLNDGLKSDKCDATARLPKSNMVWRTVDDDLVCFGALIHWGTETMSRSHRAFQSHRSKLRGNNIIQRNIKIKSDTKTEHAAVGLTAHSSSFQQNLAVIIKVDSCVCTQFILIIKMKSILRADFTYCTPQFSHFWCY